MHRREFLKQSARAVTALAVPVPLDLAGLYRAPVQRAAVPQRVLIIGAGLAGMSAAYELVEAGHDVTILEARTRPGGRVLTLREPFADGLYAEAGAMQVFDVHQRALKYLKLFELDIDPIQAASPPRGFVMHVSGHRIEVKPGQRISWPFEIREDEKDLLPRELWDKYAKAAVKQVEEADAHGSLLTAVGAYDRMTFTDFLRKQGASAAAIAILRLGLAGGLGDGSDHVSALDLLREAVHRQQVKQSYTIRGGSDRLPKAFAARLAERIHYGTPVTRIEHDRASVKVVCGRGTTRRTFTGDRLVCAVPFSIVRRMDIAPAFPPDKRAAIEQLEYTSVARVFVQTKTRFWIDKGLSGAASTDLPIMSVSERTNGQPGKRGILESYMAGVQARRATSMSERERLDTTLDGMRKVFPEIDEHVEGGASKCWDEDEWARGAYAWFRPGQMTSLLAQIARIEGRIHFAGEHTSSQPGWMEGALESGERVAREIDNAARG